MKILAIMFLELFLLMFIFADVKINGLKTDNILARAGACLIGSFILTAIFGLPVLGIVYLFTH